MALLLKPVTFFGGKGGVGKTTVAAAAALASADSGQRTLLVSTDPAHSTADILEAPLTSEPTEVAPDLDALEIDPQEEADRYIAGVKARVREVTSPGMLAEVEREIDVARAAPGAHEAALFDRFADLMALAGAAYDRVIFDTAPTGHTIRLLGLPELMQAWVDGLVSRRRKLSSLGRMWRRVAGAAAAPERHDEDPVLAALERRQARFRRAREIVTDPERTAFWFVVVPERLPILETARALDALERYAIPVGGIVVNRVLPEAADGEFLARRRERETEYLTRIMTELAGHPMIRIDMRSSDVVGLAALRGLLG
ncbi:MAG: TRC40/GET3/ArsA family transport-energizing ATPase [Gemmatimonadetes bacterium]|nr:TRC40/GET3/ArsA family transport-energizing ATPase [Gemmatimonadota bacterium]